MTSNLSDDLLNKVQTIRVDSRHGRRSPHKPLLLLLSIGRHLNGHERLGTFGDIEGDLNRLIRRFGLPDSRENAYHPFWHLRNDGLWQIDRPELVRTTTAGHAYISDLRENDIRGGLLEDFLNVLDTNPDFAWRVVGSLLNDYFPPSLHEDLLRDVGLVSKGDPSALTGTKSRHDGRDRSFREVVLRAYKGWCSLCELDVRVDGQPIGVEAAHIQWHSERGPARIENGIALCVVHHKFFDSGLFTVLSDLTVLVGGVAVGDSVEESLNKYGGLVLPVIPDRPDQRLASRYFEWHHGLRWRPNNGEKRNDKAVRSALKINFAVRQVINPAITELYSYSNYAIKQSVGIDTSEIFVARTGIRRANDLVWVGRAANHAAKLSARSGPVSQITGEVYGRLSQSSRVGDTGQSLWSQSVAPEIGNRRIYASDGMWKV